MASIESMAVFNQVNGKMVDVWLDQTVYLTKDGEEVGLGKEGDRAVVVDLIYNDDYEPGHPHESYVTLCRDEPHPNWGDGEGATEPGYGLLIVADNYTAYFTDKSHSRLQINEDVEFRGRNLKGMVGHPLTKFGRKEMFLELDEDVGGCSCDGIGKRGHCVLVPRGALVRPTKEKSSKNSK